MDEPHAQVREFVGDQPVKQVLDAEPRPGGADRGAEIALEVALGIVGIGAVDAGCDDERATAVFDLLVDAVEDALDPTLLMSGVQRAQLHDMSVDRLPPGRQIGRAFLP